MQVGDDRWELHGFGLRDHSWGPRYWQAPWYYRWLTGNVGEDFGFMGSRIARRDGPGTRGGFVWDGTTLHLCHDFRIRTTWEGDARYHRSHRSRARHRRPDLGGAGIGAPAHPAAQPAHRPDGDELVTRISEGLTAVDPRRRAGRLRAVGVPRPDRRRVTGRPGRIGAMDRATVDIYEERGDEWAAHHPPVQRAHARAFARRVPGGRCASTWDAGPVATPRTSALRSSASTRPGRCSTRVPGRGPGALLVQGDLEALPFGSHTLHGGWAHMSYLHVPSVRLPVALADLHRALVVGAPVEIQVLAGDYEGDALRRRSPRGPVLRVVDAASGWLTSSSERASTSGPSRSTATSSAPAPCGPARCPTSSGRGCASSSSVSTPACTPPTSASAMPGPATASGRRRVPAGLVTRDRDPSHALRGPRRGHDRPRQAGHVERVGPAPRASTAPGMARVERLVRWLEPAAVCFVGLTGWRLAVDRHAAAGPQPTRIGGRPVYVMPSTSGANAHARLDALAEHLRAALLLAGA